MNRPVVTVKQGKLEGIVQKNVLGSYHIAFKGIPFAAPPIGKLRFQDPQPPASWDGIRDASENDKTCSQLDELNQIVIGNEDCLYLNVYVPYQTSSRIPIIFWIHGGAFLYGSGNDITYRPDYFLTKNVILVSINYRLGAFGFLYLGHEITSGNQGLKDQIAALKWVKENIEVFGGDPENITIFGNSVGAVSAHLLSLSPLSKDLFHKAILQSGVRECSWAMKETQREVNSFKIASILGNDSKDPEEVFQFLQTVPADRIVQAQQQLFPSRELYCLNVPFRPMLDMDVKEPLFPFPINQLFNSDNDIPIIVGLTSHEYALFVDDFSDYTLSIIYGDLPHHVQKVENCQDPLKIKQLFERTKEWYFNGKPCTINNIVSLVQCMSDIYMNIPIIKFINSRRTMKKAVTYFYKFVYVGNETTLIQILGRKLHMIGATHGDELSYLFYMPMCKINDPKPPAIGSKDRKVLETITSMWSNFAKTGNPTPAIDENVSTIWLPTTSNNLSYLEINDVLQNRKIIDYTNIFQNSH